METDAPTWPSPDAETKARDSLAIALDVVVNAAQEDGSASAKVAQSLASEQLKALGGVYVAYPSADATPEGSRGGDTTSLEPTPPLGLDQAILQLRQESSADAAQSKDPTLATLARSIDLAWAQFTFVSRTPADTSGLAPRAVTYPVADGVFPPDTAGINAFAPVGSSEIGGSTAANLALAHDHARYAYEMIAANAEGEEKAAAQARSLEHKRRSDAFAAVADSDTRTSLYQLRAADLTTAQGRASVAATAEDDVAKVLEPLAATATTQLEPWILNDFFDTWAAATVLGSTAGRSPQTIDALPGIDLAS